MNAFQTRALAVAFAVLAAACSGGGNAPQSVTPAVVDAGAPAQANAEMPQATATAMPSVITLYRGAVIGLDNTFTPNDSDTSLGGNGQAVDGMPCAASMYEAAYHVHAFVGIIVNKRELALPDAIGLHGYGAESSGLTNTARCYYYLHTHDASGMVHIESPSSASLGSGIYTVGNFIDVWGERISSTSFGPYSGPVHVFVAKPPLRSLYSGRPVAFTGDPRSIKLYSHEAVWIEVGSSYFSAAQLPQVRFYTEY